MLRLYLLLCALLYAAFAFSLGFSAMPRCWSAAALARRRQRAIDRGFVTPHSGPSRKFIETDKYLAGNVRLMARSVELHARHDLLSGTPHHYARLATAAAKDFLPKGERERAQRSHKLANVAKHALPAAPSWADAWRDDEFPTLDSHASLPSCGAPPPSRPPPCPALLCDAEMQTEDPEPLDDFLPFDSQPWAALPSPGFFSAPPPCSAHGSGVPLDVELKVECAVAQGEARDRAIDLLHGRLAAVESSVHSFFPRAFMDHWVPERKAILQTMADFTLENVDTMCTKVEKLVQAMSEWLMEHLDDRLREKGASASLPSPPVSPAAAAPSRSTGEDTAAYFDEFFRSLDDPGVLPALASELRGTPVCPSPPQVPPERRVTFGDLTPLGSDAGDSTVSLLEAGLDEELEACPDLADWASSPVSDDETGAAGFMPGFFPCSDLMALSGASHRAHRCAEALFNLQQSPPGDVTGPPVDTSSTNLFEPLGLSVGRLG